MGVLLTVGHGTLGPTALPDLLRAADVTAVVDVRRFPGSRTHPHVRREELAERLPEQGTAYRWDPRLGGRRRLPVGVPTPDTWWTVPAFAAYAGHTRTEEFAAGVADVLTLAGDLGEGRVALLCSEALWWRCHRRLVADVLVLLHGQQVLHLVHDGRLHVHQPAAGARVSDEGLVWDRG
jgi:uncharacterized protein (DUF488 family)